MQDLSADPKSWAAYAEDDLVLARAALRRARPLTAGACFHAQQCAEKYLKAILVARDQAFPKTHDLRTLNDLCVTAGALVGIDIERLDALTSYAVSTRYPGPLPSKDDAREALETARTV